MKAQYYYLGTSACKVIASSFSPLSIDDSEPKVKTFDEKICISYREGRKWTNLFFSPEELPKRLPYLALMDNRAYYITNQSLYGNTQNRRTSSLFSFHNIIIDIDAHEYLKQNKDDYDFQEKIEQLIFCINKDTCDIQPNFIVKTSRGIQCWWNFEETSKVLQFAYQRAVNTLCRVVKDILSDNNLDSIFSVDTASKKPLGLFRLPGSFNPTSNQFTEISANHTKKYDFNDFNEYITNWFELHWNEPKKKKKSKITPITRAEKGYLPLLIKRTRLIENMVEKGLICIGKREVALFLYFNSLRQLPYLSGTPEELTAQLNQQLEVPLKKSELQAIFRNHKIYKISNHLFFDYLEITEDSAKEIYMTKSNFARDYERKVKKNERNKEIVRRYSTDSQSILGISKDMGISRNTVKSVLRELGFIARKED